MTGIIKLDGFDTETNQRYLFLAGDTQGTFELDGEYFKYPYDNKIFSSNNYMIANRGFAVFDNGNCFGSNLLQGLLLSDELDFFRINEAIKDVDSIYGIKTNFFVADKRNLKFHDLGDKKEIIYGDSWATTGRGAPYIEKVLSLLPRGKILKMPMTKVLEYAYCAINYAAKYNEKSFTGGFFSFGAVGEKDIKLRLNLKKLCN